MKHKCQGTPGAASWGRCEKPKGHAPPCTHDVDPKYYESKPKRNLGGAPSLDLVTACQCQDEPILAYQDGSGAWQPATRISNHTGLELVLVRVVEKASS